MAAAADRRPKVTVGIPVYDDARTITNCLVSVAAQTMPEDQIEVICVDDGSTDATPALIDDFADRHPELVVRRLHHDHTGGPATGRNTILEQASGEFIYYLDGDDYLGGRALQEMYDLSAEQGADVVIGKFVGVQRGVPKHMFRATQAHTSMLEWNVIDSLNVLKMFRTDFVRALPYRFDTTLRMAEDHPFTLNAYLHADGIAVLAEVDCYYWVRHSNEEGRPHLTSADLSVDEFLAYLPVAFQVIGAADVAPEVREAVRTQYWKRLLTFDLWNEARRDREPLEQEISYVRAHDLARTYSTPETLAALPVEVAFRLRLLLNASAPLYLNYVQIKSR